MKKTTSNKKVVLLSDQLLQSTDGNKKPNLVLPSIKFLPGAKAQDGLIKLADGGYRQVFAIDGFALSDFYYNARSIEEKFKDLLATSACDIQLILSSRPFPAGTAENYHAQFCKTKNDYFTWYSDYLFKWFCRATDVHYLPRRSFYLVLTLLPTAKAGKTDGARQKAFNKAAGACLKKLQKLGQNPQLLCGEELRLLLSQSFLTPPDKPQTYPMSKLAQCLSQSTIMEPAVSERPDYIKIDDLYHGSCAITQLPDEIDSAWMYWPVVESAPYTLSVHFHQCDQKETRQAIKKKYPKGTKSPDIDSIAGGTGRAVEVSIYISTFGKTKGELTERLNRAKTNFRRKGSAAGGASGKQKATWQSCLPLGSDQASLRHRVSADVASNLWPCVSDVPGKHAGFFLGYGSNSHAPVFIDPNAKDDYLIVASKAEESDSLMTLLATKYAVAGFNVLYLGKSAYPEMLVNVFGSQTSSVIAADSLDREQADPAKSFTLIHWKKNQKANMAVPGKIIEAAGKWIGENRQVIFIEDSSLVIQSKTNRQALIKLLQRASAASAQVYMAVPPALLGEIKTLKHSFSNKIIFVPARSDVQHIRKHIDKNFYYAKPSKEPNQNYPCALLRDSKLWYVSLLWSPMDVGLLARSHIKANDASNHAERRKAIYDEVRSKNPQMPETDAWRQAIYYFGLQTS
jgi:hypothetical protein